MSRTTIDLRLSLINILILSNYIYTYIHTTDERVPFNLVASSFSLELQVVEFHHPVLYE